jgi:hypothetical protein
MLRLVETDKAKAVFSDEFNSIFDKQSGETAYWGCTLENDPECAPFPMILDMEITTSCYGIGTVHGRKKDAVLKSNPCPFCYKANHPEGRFMSLDKARNILETLPRGLTQIAYGADASLVGNPEWYSIFNLSRGMGFIPNVTVADISDETAEKLASVCGAVAVSWYGDKECCFGSVEALHRYGLKHVNIHCLLSKETLARTFEVIDCIATDPRLKDLYAIVFLSLKRKGRGERFHRLSSEEFNQIVEKCRKLGISFGFDSCSASKYLSYAKDNGLEWTESYCDMCESGRMSYYINVDGMGYPCSFSEGIIRPIDVCKAKYFIDDVWNHPTTQCFRELSLMNGCRCTLYNV